MEDIRKRLIKAEERVEYLIQVKDSKEWGNLGGTQEKILELKRQYYDLGEEELAGRVHALEEAIEFLEARCEESLSPMERVRIVRSPLRFSLKDILENVYDDYTELGGVEENNIDPAIVVAKANLLRRFKKKAYTQQVMVIGHEKGHNEEFRNGGSAKPWGN